MFNKLDKTWGAHTKDGFSCDYNKKCLNFNSKYWCPGTCGIDAFNYDWSNDNNWIFPPPSLILRCIQKIRSEKVKCTLVVPKWTSAAYWPLITTDGKTFDKFIVDSILFGSEHIKKQVEEYLVFTNPNLR